MTSRWLIPAGLIALATVPAIAGTMRLVQLAAGGPITADNFRFFESPVPVVLHIATVVVYSILGAFQFSPGLRRQRRGWHRAAGRILIPCGLLAALTGLWMAHFYPWPEGDGQVLYLERLIVGTAMTAFIVASVFSLRRRDFASHGKWMIRAYAIGIGAGTQVLTHLPWLVIGEGKPGEFPRAVMMGAGWAINMVVAEWIVRRRDSRPNAMLATAG